MLIYRKLEVWHLAKEFAIDVYSITKDFPVEEKFGLVSQLNRAAISISSNIAEGTSRSSMKEQAHFSEIAYGSLMEAACQLEIAKDLKLLSSDKWELMNNKVEEIAQKLSSLRNSQLKRI